MKSQNPGDPNGGYFLVDFFVVLGGPPITIGIRAGTPNYQQESLEILLEILLGKLLSTEAGNKTKHAPRAEARWRILALILEHSIFF